MLRHLEGFELVQSKGLAAWRKRYQEGWIERPLAKIGEPVIVEGRLNGPQSRFGLAAKAHLWPFGIDLAAPLSKPIAVYDDEGFPGGSLGERVPSPGVPETIIVGLAVRVDRSEDYRQHLVEIGTQELVSRNLSAFRRNDYWLACLSLSGALVPGRSFTTNNSGVYAPRLLEYGRWYYLEWKSSIDGGSHVSTLRVDGDATVQIEGAVTSGHSRASRVIFIAPVEGTGAIDDIYVCDDAGTIRNDFLGDGFIEGREQTSGKGVGA